MRGIGNAYCLADNAVGRLPVVGGITVPCYPKEATFTRRWSKGPSAGQVPGHLETFLPRDTRKERNHILARVIDRLSK